MVKKRIVVIGSTNVDMVVKTHHLPGPGETVLGGAFFMNSGGKGANQAVAIARLGGAVTFISKVGNDIFGKQAIQSFQDAAIDIEHILIDRESPSGVALITVDGQGENSIVVAGGANANLSPEEVERSLWKIPDAGILLVQLEIPIDTVAFAVKYAAAHAIRVILNPAPCYPLEPELFKLIDIITPNSNEAEMLTGIVVDDVNGAKRAAEWLQNKGVKNVVITLGKKGAVFLQDGNLETIGAPEVNAIDTTAAGDVFNGALAVKLSEGNNLLSSLQFACRAAAITTTRMGAQSSIPYRDEFI